MQPKEIKTGIFPTGVSSKFAWGGLIVLGLSSYFGFRYWIDTNAKTENKRVERLLEEQKTSAEKIRMLTAEKEAAESKLAAIEAQRARLAEEQERLRKEAEDLTKFLADSNSRLKKLENNQTKPINVVVDSETDYEIVEVDLNAINTQFNCFIKSANEGQIKEECYAQ